MSLQNISEMEFLKYMKKKTHYSSISMDSNLKTDLSLDSLDKVEMVMELEDKFDIFIPEDTAMSMNTVRDVYQGIKNSPYT
jgi:acyl carrier protein